MTPDSHYRVLYGINKRAEPMDVVVVYKAMCYCMSVCNKEKRRSTPTQECSLIICVAQKKKKGGKNNHFAYPVLKVTDFLSLVWHKH